MNPDLGTATVCVTAEEAGRQSLAGGAVGIALLHLERACAGEESWRAAHSHLWQAAAGRVDAGDHAGLYYGAPALAFALGAVADRHRTYRTVADDLLRYVERLTRRRLRAAAARIESREPARFAEFDVFYGLTGLGSLLLRHAPGSATLRDVLRYVVALTQSRRHGGIDIPGWWVAHDPDPLLPTPGGHANLGMAHGAAGLLALLALATLRGDDVDGQPDALHTLTNWFDRWQQGSAGRVWWPQWITHFELRAGHTTWSGPGAPSWCYGTVGIARAQQLAAIATQDPARQHLAERALADALSDIRLRRVADDGLCHGLAGVYQTAYRAAADAYHSGIGDRLPAIAAELRRRAAQPRRDAGLLTGRAGLDLALMTTRHAAPPHTGWDACLLIS